MNQQPEWTDSLLRAQNGEDHVLLGVLGRDGYFVDVGAFDGVHLSNTFALAQVGWRGVCVEPSPRWFRALERNRPETTCVHAACGDMSGEMHLHEDMTGLLSSLRPDQGMRQRAELAARARGLQFAEPTATAVQVRPLDDILHEVGTPVGFDLLSVDVEGHEDAVLAGFDLSHWQPRVVVIEGNDRSFSQRLVGLMADAGYALARTIEVNHFFVREPRVAEAIRGHDLTCILPPNPHPLGSEFTAPVLRSARIMLQGRAMTLGQIRAALGSSGGKSRPIVRLGGAAAEGTP